MITETRTAGSVPTEGPVEVPVGGLPEGYALEGDERGNVTLKRGAVSLCSVKRPDGAARAEWVLGALRDAAISHRAMAGAGRARASALAAGKEAKAERFKPELESARRSYEDALRRATGGAP